MSPYQYPTELVSSGSIPLIYVCGGSKYRTSCIHVSFLVWLVCAGSLGGGDEEDEEADLFWRRLWST
jgi:hypothetical protein